MLCTKNKIRRLFKSQINFFSGVSILESFEYKNSYHFLVDRNQMSKFSSDDDQL